MTANPVHPALRARAANRLKDHSDATTSDKDILRRCYFYIDVDPIRPSEISATAEEHAAALGTTAGIVCYLTDQGWPDPVVVGSSGNGGMILYQVDLPNDAQSKELLDGVVAHLAERFGTDDVAVDSTVTNAARIVKIPGTVAKKGDHLPGDRPHRIAVAETHPDAGTVSREHLEVLAALGSREEPSSTGWKASGPSRSGKDKTSGQQSAGGGAALNEVETALKAKGIGYTLKVRHYGTVLDLHRCLTSDAHEAGACITVFPSGARQYKCHHQTCKGKGWRDVAPLLGLGRPDENTGQAKAGQTAGPRAINGADLLRRSFEPVRWVVPNRLTEGLHIFAGAPKIGKSWAMLDAALAVTSGGAWLGEPVPSAADVLYLALEDNERRLHPRLKKLLYGGASTQSSFGPADLLDDDFVIDLSDLPPMPERLTFWTECPPLDKGGLDHIGAWLAAHPPAGLVIVDTLGKVRPARGKNGNAYDEDYAALTGLQRLAGQHSVAIVVVHHLRKMASDDPLERISGTMALPGAADGLLVMQRERGKETATLLVTGRDVEQELNLALAFDADTARWSVLGDADELRRTQEQQEVIAALTEAGEPLTPSQVAERLGQPVNRIKQRLFQMAKRHQIRNANGKYSYG